MLFDPLRHEPLTGGPWDAPRASLAIQQIVSGLEEEFTSERFWPVHPLDSREAKPGDWNKSLYLGAAGTLWALWHLEREGAAELTLQPVDLISRVAQSYYEKPDTDEVVPSTNLGEVGVLLVLWRLTGSADAAERLWVAIEKNTGNPTNEALWGNSGTMLGAWHMLQWTEESRWRDLFLRCVDALWQTWLPSSEACCHLWTQDLYGRIAQFIGAGHGFAGNVLPLLKGAALLPPERSETLFARCLETVKATGIFEGEAANWPARWGLAKTGNEALLVQWCHGAPGIVTSLTDFPRGRSADLERMLHQAGTTIWEAGPLRKGFGLCHGTAGNGYALLELHRRSGEGLWLERARAFAMHAIAQSESMRKEYGQHRSSLWTGDPGLAIYLWHCLTGRHGLPGLDLFD